MTTKIPAELSSTPGISDSSNATAITIDSSENVGIGITSPKTNLDIASATGAVLTLTDTRTVATAGDLLGKINFYNSDASGDGAQNAASIAAFHNGSIGNGGFITFSTTTGSSGSEGAEPTERVRILADGKVGIGTSTPNYPLVVAGTNPKIQIYDSDGNGQTNLYFGDSGSNLAGYVIYQHSDDKMRIGTNASDKLVINSSGDVGIGTSSPNVKLYVTGNDAGNYLSVFYHDGNNNDRYGIRILAGTDDNSGVIYHIRCDDGDGHVLGYLQHENGTLAVQQASDERLKENIVDSTLEGINTLKNIRQREFNLKRDTSKTKIVGYIAQEMESVYPAAISVMDATQDGSAPEDDLENPYKTLSKTALIDVLIKATQEQQTIIETQQTTINDLKSRIETLEG
tara:strand:- start:43 stop:1242 length:1200 start_codon:yes stop_codon:yes gene_type:complete